MWWTWRSGQMWRDCAAALLVHVNLLLTVYGGATLATAARLKWDPSTYVVVRELFPAEYRAAALCTALHGAALLLLAHLAVAALHVSKHLTRRILLYIYAAVMTLLVIAEIVFSAWLAQRVWGWLQSEAALQLEEAMELRQYLKPVLQYFSRWHPLPQRIESLIEEAEQDAPRNVYAAGAAGLLLALLQPLAVLLALSAARREPAPSLASRARTDSAALVERSYSERSVWRWRGASPRHVLARCVTTTPSHADYGKAPLRTAYKNGRIVIL